MFGFNISRNETCLNIFQPYLERKITNVLTHDYGDDDGGGE
jgi:hypothetical protein